MKLMGGKIKKFFLNFNGFNKPAVLAAVFFFVFLGLAFPSQFVQAGFLDVLASIPVMIITLLLQLVLVVSNLILGIAGLILGWVVGPYFTTLPYTHGGIVEVGWPIVRDFINIFFVIALVVIGLSTSLRIKEYQAQKALPILITIAILINFTPVICGLIIDAANILMNFFLEELTGLQLMKRSVAMQGSAIWEAFSHPFDFRYAVTALGKTVVMIIFAWVAAYIFLIYSLLFIMRYVMLWALVIVSPIAFFSRIFPGSQKYLFKSILGWAEWWKQFIEWSLLGVIAGFFLYLAEQLMMLAPGMISGLPPGQGGGGWVGNPIVTFVNNFLPWMVVLVFLWIGYKITKEISAMGAQGAIKAVDAGIKIVGTAAVVAATGGAAAGLAAKGLAGATKGAQRMEAFIGKVPVVGKPLKYGMAKPISWATRGMEKAATPTLLEYQAKTRRVPEADLKKIDGMSGTEAEKYINAQTSMLPPGVAKQRRLQYMARVAEKENLEFTSPEFQKEAGELKAEIRKKENPYLQKEATTVAKALPETVGDEELVHSKLVGITDPAKRKEKEDEIRKDIQETRDIIQNRIGRENFTIEAGLKLKWVTKGDVERDRTAALAAIQRRATLQPGELAKTQGNIAASATFTKELKPEDMKKMIDPDAFATRVGITLGNPRNLQRIQDNFGIKKLKAVIEGRGGLNDATNSSEKLDKFNEINPQMVNAILNSPAYRELDIEARKHMRDPNDQPTTNFYAFKGRARIQAELMEAPPTLKSFNKLHTEATGYQKSIEELQMRGKSTKTQEKQLEATLKQVASKWQRIEKSKPLRNQWLDIEKLRNPRQAEVLQRDAEAGLRIEGILRTEPLLSRFDNLHLIEEEHKRKRMKAEEKKRYQAAEYWLRREFSANERQKKMKGKIDGDDKLREKWEEIEKLRRPPEEKKGKRRKNP